MLESKATASDGSASTISAAQACGDYADAYCTLLEQCEPFHVPLWFADLATCKQRMALPCLAMLGNPGTTWNGDRMEKCAQAVSMEGCTRSSWYNHTLLPECVPPPGAGDDATPCRDGGQCKSSHCFVPNNSLDGTCAPAPTAATSSASPATSMTTAGASLRAIYFLQTAARLGPK